MMHLNICTNTATAFSMKSNKIGMATGSGLPSNSCEKMSSKKTTRPYKKTRKNTYRLINTRRVSIKEIRVRYPFWMPILLGTALVCRKPEISQALTSRWPLKIFLNKARFLVGHKNTYQVRGIRVKDSTGILWLLRSRKPTRFFRK